MRGSLSIPQLVVLKPRYNSLDGDNSSNCMLLVSALCSVPFWILMFYARMTLGPQFWYVFFFIYLLFIVYLSDFVDLICLVLFVCIIHHFSLFDGHLNHDHLSRI